MAIENSIVGSYQKVEDTCVEKRFAKKGDGVEDVKERLKHAADHL